MSKIEAFSRVIASYVQLSAVPLPPNWNSLFSIETSSKLLLLDSTDKVTTKFDNSGSDNLPVAGSIPLTDTFQLQNPLIGYSYWKDHAISLLFPSA